MGGFPFLGKLAGLTFYRRKGKWVARQIGGMSREQMMHDPAMFRIRNHHSEFKSWSKGRSSLKSALNHQLQLGDGTLHNRLFQVCSQITNKEDGEKGKRPLLFSRYKDILLGFEVNGERRLESLVSANIGITPLDDATGATARITRPTISPPTAATFYQFILLVGVVSDLMFDEKKKEYVFAVPEVNAMAEVSHTDYFSVDDQRSEIVLETRLPLTKVPETTAVFAALGIRFFDKSGGQFRPFHTHRALTILGAW